MENILFALLGAVAAGLVSACATIYKIKSAFNKQTKLIESKFGRQDTPLDKYPEDVPDDVLIKKSIELAHLRGRLTTSRLQQELRIGYNRAARIMEKLRDYGIIEREQTGDRCRYIKQPKQTESH